jgi:ribosomal protein S18 acetylase RimI-like enzyme
MPSITIHYDNASSFAAPHLWVRYAGSAEPDHVAPSGQDAFGPVFTPELTRPDFEFGFADGGAEPAWEDAAALRAYRIVPTVGEIWCRADKAFVFDVEADAAHRGRGHGRTLMLLAESQAIAAGRRALELNVHAGNTPAERLYESLGYETTLYALYKPLL